ncbi:ribonuclease domain-containing protein [Pantoea sp. 1.19]|uniref:ribonuclease domain-containing protein n=1 Tax=Pantoea sp. 1.19 TaxID=1925589 RepID=UPI000948EA9F|nr:ribonuclease domain-containing protein [Pantoea sp. 1.19]
MKHSKLIIALAVVAAILAGIWLRQDPLPPATENARGAQLADALTAEVQVVNYLRQHRRLPDYYVTKREARAAGWDARAGNLCEVLPGKAIGGDRFGNREQQLPMKAGRQWFEADINYRCGRRGAERLLYSTDGLIYLTRDHYRHVEAVK